MKTTLQKFVTMVMLCTMWFEPSNVLSKPAQGAANNMLAPSWTRTYPAVTKGITSVYFKVRLNQRATIYYAFYNASVQSVTAQELKADVALGSASKAIRFGSLVYTDPAATADLLTNGFEKDSTYHLFLVAETDDKMMDDAQVKHFTLLFTMRQKIIPKDSTASPFGYLEYLPKGYAGFKDSLFPLIVFLHGSGAAGQGTYATLSSTTGMLREGIIRYLEMDLDLPAVILSPQAPGWNPQKLDTFFTFAKQHYRVDTNRFYLTGISMGGAGTWYYSVAYPKKLAASMPLCGAYSGHPNFKQLANLPLWAFHNDKDPTVPLSFTEYAINEIISAGGNPFLSVFESDDHSVAYDAYHYPGVWQWLLAQKRVTATHNEGFTNVYKTYHQPAIDGNLDDSCWMVAQNYLHPFSAASFRLLWDETNMYIGVTIPETAIAPDAYEVSLFLNGNNSNNSTYDSFDKALHLNFSSSDITGIGNLQDIAHAWHVYNDSLTLEIALPFANGFCPNPFAGSGFGFDIAVLKKPAHDTTFWFGNEQDSANTSHLGHLLLALKTAGANVPGNAKSIGCAACTPLLQCYPNPFTTNTQVVFNVPKATTCVVKVFDGTGKEVAVLKNGFYSPGKYALTFNGSKLPQGCYCVSLQTSSGKAFQRIVKY